MTEAEWLRCKAPKRMFAWLLDRASGRKLRLFALAVWFDHHAADRNGYPKAVEANWRYVQQAEELADGLRAEADDERRVWLACQPDPKEAAGRAVRWRLSRRCACPPARLAALLREVFGNPWRPPPPALSAWLAWEGGTVPKVAAAIYAERAFDRLPVLADALEEAGCADAELLAHLRGAGPHFRGCWALDLLLGQG